MDTEAKYKRIKDLSREEFILPGTTVCGGCGGLEALRLFHKVLGKNVVFVNAAGCFTLLALFPYSPFRGAWLYTTMASAPAGAQGVRDALDILISSGRLKPEDDMKVVVLAGDGSTYDMALSSTSGAVFRDLDFYYFCYDNEAYGNTGMQMSSASPFGSMTTTTKPANHAATGTTSHKKDIFEIWRAHKPPYLATISPRHPVDLSEKVRRSMQFRGPKLFIAFSPCPTGWMYEPSLTIRISRMAVDTGVWALKEAVYGKMRHTCIPSRLKPVEEYLQMQGRFKHLFTPHRQEETIKKIQDDVNNYWTQYKGLAD